MKINKMVIVGALAMLSAGVANAAPEATITTPEGQTTVEVNAPARIEVDRDASTTVIVNEPSGTHHTHMDADHDRYNSWNPRDRFHYDRDADETIYPDQEFSIDLFGAFGDEKAKFNDTFDTTMRDGEWGAGIGINYFFARCIGVGADVFGLDNGSDVVDAANASLILRLPIDFLHLAPYAFGGAGRQLQGADSWTAHVGAGLELRFNQHTGLFLDGRHVFSDKGTDYALLRSGLRFAF